MNAVIYSANWLFVACATAMAILCQAVRPITWRRTVRAEFWRFMELVCLRNMRALLIAGGLIGLALVSQGLYWLDRFGQPDEIRQVIVLVMVREVGPLIVGFLVLGSGGIILINEVSAMRSTGQMDDLDRQGVDPFLLIVVPRVIALVVATFSHTIIFVVVALIAGHAMAQAVGATAIEPVQFLISLLAAIGSTGYIALPVKTIAIGLTIGTVCSLSAMDPATDGLTGGTFTATGFIRAVSGILLVSTLLSLVL